MISLETLELMEMYHVAVLPLGKQWIAGVPFGGISVSVDSPILAITLPAWRTAATVDEAVRDWRWMLNQCGAGH